VICPLCFGRGKFPVVRVRSEDGSFVVTQELPCPECHGSGIALPDDPNRRPEPEEAP
jgi:DnaJ-class molecular chaperone